MLSLKLFNAVLAGETVTAPTPPRVVDTLPLGYVIAPSAGHLADEIVAYYQRENLDGNQLNQTFHKSWETVQTATRDELLGHQLLHYLSTYGFRAMGVESDFIYLPAEVSEVPELAKAPVRVIHGLSADELAERCFALVNSGIALARETLDDILALLREIDRLPTEPTDVRNKEFLILLADETGVFTGPPTEFLRYLLYRATGKTLLIKNRETVAAIRASDLRIGQLVADYGAERCAEIFLRFKPLWLAFKQFPVEPAVATPPTIGSAFTGLLAKVRSKLTARNKRPRPGTDRPPSGHVNARTVNRISKLAKKFHRPLPADYLNGVTALDEVNPAELTAALDKANVFRKIRLLYALSTRLSGGEYRMYRIRNGKSYVTPVEDEPQKKAGYEAAYALVLDHLVAGLDVKGKTFLFSEGIEYALPATEKMFVGNFPVGSFIRTKTALTVGIYWENAWGAQDLDLSAAGLGKVGWNAAYNKGGVTYSGDITDAPNGATELLRFGAGVEVPHLVNVNVYSGKPEVAFKVMVGEAASVSANYMFQPDELRAEVKTTTNTRQQVIGYAERKNGEQRFVFSNVGSGNSQIAGNVNAGRLALYHQWSDAPMLRDVLVAAGAKITTDPAATFDVDLRWEVLGKDSILGLLA